MGKERISNIEDVLSNMKVGKDLLSDWINENVALLCKETGLIITQEEWEVKKDRLYDTRATIIMGIKEVKGVGEVGFVVDLIDQELDSVSVFVDLGTEFRWIRRKGNKERSYSTEG